ncbi:MAG: 30S ribosomal protein S4 [Patescibacteria group bacterium]
MKIGPKYKIARRLGERIFPKTQTSKFAISGSEKRAGGGRPRAMSDYGKQLIEKQKARYTYGVTEKQFSNYVKKVKQASGTNKSAELYRLLERRLDNVVFRLGLANSRLFARQLVSHGHIVVNDRRVTIPSYQVLPGDKIKVRAGSKELGPFKNLEEKIKNQQVPEWLKGDPSGWEVASLPSEQAGELNLNFGTIIEFYSRV